MRILIYKTLLHLFPKLKTIFDAHFFNNVKLTNIIKSNFNDIFFNSNACYLNGYTNSSNFGDALNRPLLFRLGCKRIVLTNAIIHKGKENLIMIGSSIHLSDQNSIIWGAGCISPRHLPANKPKSIKAVRGPLTRELLISNEIDCPEIYGDPALLLPIIYSPKRHRKKYKLGVVPHYVDKDNKTIQLIKSRKDILIINIEVGSNYKYFINQIVSCEGVISSSLHGLIVADAYGIPNVWCEFGDEVVGDGFKFKDYFASVGRSTTTPIDLRYGFNEELINNHLAHWLPISYDPTALLRSFPYPHKIKTVI